MGLYVGYEKTLQNEIQELLTIKKPIVLFGTLVMGDIARKALDFLNVKPACFCDNNEKKQGTVIEGLSVLSPRQVKEQYPNAKIYICSFNIESINHIKKCLKKIDLHDVCSSDMLWYVYQTKVKARPISTKDIADTFEIINNRDNKLIIGTLSVVLTEKCSLKCEGCAALIPYFNSPKTYDKTEIIKSLEVLSQSVDAIENIVMFGGEPMMHPDLAEICEAASKIRNVRRLQIITNGTIVPNEAAWEKLRDNIVYITISDYGDLSKKKYDLKNKAKEYDVPLEFFELNMSDWTDRGGITPCFRSNEELRDMFRECMEKINCPPVLVNGEYHLCSKSGFGTSLGVVEKRPQDYVNLLDSTLSIDEISTKLGRLINDSEYLSACDYCERVFVKGIAVATQIDRG